MQNKVEEKQKIRDFLQVLKGNYGTLPKYAYVSKEFDNKVYYSGPIVDDDEMVAAIHTLFFGSWSTSGGEVAKFEILYSNIGLRTLPVRIQKLLRINFP